MRAVLIISSLLYIFNSNTFAQAPAITNGDVAHGSLGGTYVATASATNFFAAEVISATTSREIKIKKYDASGIISSESIYRDRCETCKTTENLPLQIFPTSDGGAILYYEIEANTPIFRKITPDGRATWTNTYNNLKFIKASPNNSNGMYLTFQVTSGVNINNYFVYSIDLNGTLNWTAGLLSTQPTDLATTADGGVIITDTDSTKRYDSNGKKLWAINRGANLVRVVDSDFAYQADANRLFRFSLNTGEVDFLRDQANINDLQITPDKGVILATNTLVQKINATNAFVWTTNVGSQCLTLTPNGNIGSVGTGANTSRITVYNANGIIQWQKTMTYNLAGKLTLYAAPDNGWFVTTRGEAPTKPSTHGVGFLYRIAADNTRCTYSVAVSPNTKQFICKTGNLTFEVSQPNLDLSYGLPSTDYIIQWLRNNGVVETNKLNYTANQEGQYFARITQGGNCINNSPTIDIEVLGLLTPTITPDITELCTGGGSSVRFTAAGCPSNATVLWSDNQSGLSVNVSPNVTTDYSARCVQSFVQNNTAQTCLSNASNTRRITLLPSSNLSIPNGIVSANAICQGSSETLSVQVAGNPLAPVSYFWSRNNTTVGTQSTFTATQEGNYQISIKDRRGCTAQSSVKPLGLVGTKTPTVTSNFNEICLNGGVSPIISATGCTNAAILWNTGNNTSTIRVAPTVTTEYKARCVDTFNAADGSPKTCSGVESTPTRLTVLQQSNIVITDLFTPEVFCKNDTQDTIRTEVKNFQDPLIFNWFRDANLISTDLEIVVSDPGNYQLKVRDARGCTQESIIKKIDRSELEVTITGERAFCEGNSTQLQATSSKGIGSTSYEWQLESRAFSTNTNITVLNPGNYILKATDSKGCQEQVSVPIKLHPKIVAGYSKNPTVKGNLFYNFDETKLLEGTRPFNVTLTAVSETNEIIPITANTIGKFTKNSTVYVRATDANNCVFLDSIRINYQPCNVAVSIAGDTSFCYYESVTLQASQATGVQPFAFTWSIGNSQFPNENNPTLITGTTGTYRTTLTDSAQCVVTSNPFTIKDRGRDIVAFIRTNGDSLAYRPFGVDLSAPLQERVVYQWFRNDTLIVNEITPTLYATETGNYKVRVSKDGCFNNSNEIQITILTPLSAEENYLSNDVIAYPNPVEEQFTIRTQTPSPITAICRVTDTNGRQMFQETTKRPSTQNEWTVDASRWAVGVYIYHISTANGEAFGKIIKR